MRGKNTGTIKCLSLGHNEHYAEILAQVLNERYVPKQAIEQRIEFECIVRSVRSKP